MKYKHVALVAVSGTGKGTISKCLMLLIAGLRTAVSATTRSPRDGEIEGVHYYFLTRTVFMEKIEAGEFAEWFEYNGNLYGTLLSEVEKREKEGLPILFDIEINGAMMLKKSLGERLITVFLDCPIEECEKRLRNRDIVATEEYIQSRMLIGREEEIPRKHECDELVWYGVGADPAFTSNEIANLMRA